MTKSSKNRRPKLSKSEQMARVRTRGTAAELTLQRVLRECGIDFRLDLPLPGRPDLAFERERVAVFVDGCFWHGCPEHYTAPATNADFWRRKLEQNQARDREATRALTEAGWRVVRLWEHEIEQDPDMAVNKVISALAEVGLLSAARCE